MVVDGQDGVNLALVHLHLLYGGEYDAIVAGAKVKGVSVAGQELGLAQWHKLIGLVAVIEGDLFAFVGRQHVALSFEAIAVMVED